MTGIRHHHVTANGLRVHAAEAGPVDGPPVLCCHGFPETWWSWRHQLATLGDAGYRVIAPDLRGYGGTDAPDDWRVYSMLHLVGDAVGLLDALDVDAATIVGHDWGGPLAWWSAAMRPDRFPSVAVLGVPFTGRGEAPPVATMRAVFGDAWFYFLYFQDPGVAEAELDPRAAAMIRGFVWTLSGDAPGDGLRGLATGGEGPGLLDRLSQPDALPPWLSEDDLAVHEREFERTGFRGGLSWYRAADLSWELTAAWADVRIHQPALFVAGERDGVLAMVPGAVEALPELVPGLRDSVILPGCGHWTQQERPAEVSGALLRFLADLPS